MTRWLVTVDYPPVRSVPLAVVYVDADTQAQALDKVREMLGAVKLTAYPRAGGRVARAIAVVPGPSPSAAGQPSAAAPPQQKGKTTADLAPALRSEVRQRRRRAQDVAFDAIAAETGADPRVEGGRIARALSTIRVAYEQDVGHTLPGKIADDTLGSWDLFAREIKRRAALYRSRYPGIELTPTALAANWTRVTLRKPSSFESALDDVRRATREDDDVIEVEVISEEDVTDREEEE